MRVLKGSWLGGGVATVALLATLAFWLYVALGSQSVPAGRAGSPPSVAPVSRDPVSSNPAPSDPVSPPHDHNELALGAQELVRQLARQPGDAGSWQLLARTYASLGQDEASLAALRRGTEALPRNLDLLLAYADALLARIDDETLPAPFVDVMTRINAIDPDQADSLWYLGIAAANRGDSDRARALWERLLARLPADHPARADLQNRLLKLR